MALLMKNVSRLMTTGIPLRFVNCQPAICQTVHHCSTNSGPSGAPDDASSKPTKEPTEDKKAKTKAKLNALLESFKKVDGAAEGDSLSDRLARPGRRPTPRNVVRRPSPGPTGPEPDSGVQPTPPREPSKPLTLDEQLRSAARDVASSLGSDAARTETELLAKLSGSSSSQQQTEPSRLDLSELMSSMKVQRETGTEPEEAADVSRAQRVRQQIGERRALTVRQMRRDRSGGAARPAGVPEQVDLNSGQPLGIFSQLREQGATESAALTASSTWRRLHERELRLSVTHPPSNAWEEMILWTEQGKLWHLPVDNERGLEAEAAVGFHEHVFLERHLEPWCPPRGPIRHFMELVCIGLGKNPWLTVEEKQEHIQWYRDYFAGKQELLKELGAI